MRIAIISNTEHFIPLAYSLANQNLPVQLYFSPSADSYINQKVWGFAKQFNIGITEQKSPKDLYNWLLNGKYDICFMLGYASLIDLDRLKHCPTKIYNIHFGPLPAFRGPVPVFWQLKQGNDKIGLSIHELSQKFDDGPLIWAKEVPNLPHYNYALVNQLFGQLCTEGAVYILRMLLLNKVAPAPISTTAEPEYQKRPGPNEVSINWQTMPSEEICNLVRACNPWNKGAASFFNGQEVKVLDAQIMHPKVASLADMAPGSILDDEQNLQVACTDKKTIQINMLFYSEFYIPAYQAKLFGFRKGQKFG